MKTKYPGVRNGQVEAAINKMGGMDALKQFLCGEKVLVEPRRIWRQTWRTLNFGLGNRINYSSVDTLKSVICDGDARIISPEAELLMDQINMDEYPTVNGVELVKVSGYDLGIKLDFTTWKEVLRAGCELGLDDCWLEIAPELLVHGVGLDNQEEIRIAMHPVQVNRRTFVFWIARYNSVTRLYAMEKSVKSTIRTSDQFIFQLRK